MTAPKKAQIECYLFCHIQCNSSERRCICLFFCFCYSVCLHVNVVTGHCRQCIRPLLVTDEYGSRSHGHLPSHDVSAACSSCPPMLQKCRSNLAMTRALTHARLHCIHDWMLCSDWFTSDADIVSCSLPSNGSSSSQAKPLQFAGCVVCHLHGGLCWPFGQHTYWDPSKKRYFKGKLPVRRPHGHSLAHGSVSAPAINSHPQAGMTVV